MGLTVVRSGIDHDASSAPPPGLRSLIADEVFAQATEEQAAAFFVAVGGRLAAGHPLPENAGVAVLEAAINDVWHRLDLGQVTLAMAADGIVIDHHGYAAGAGASPVWSRAAAALLRGAYDAWFRSIGGDALHTRFVRQTSERIILHHGA